MEFKYSYDKSKCWYKDICKKDKCDVDTLCDRHYRMEMLVQRATMSGKQRETVSLYPEKVDLQAFKRLKEIREDINRFVTSGKNLLIYSEHTGNGKTEWSKKLLMSWFNSIWATSDFECRGLFVEMPRFIQSMKENISKPNEYYQYVNENISSADLVVWDEINYKTYSEFEMDYLLSVISSRISQGKSNIFTTNYSLPVIQEKLGSRLSSRVIGSSEVIQFLGSDRRGDSRHG